MLLSLKIVHARTGGSPTLAQFTLRYIMYFVSLLPLGLGLLLGSL